mmetsp:Transcript_28612/g.101365  ORF Transcript_28612/g.101365 Transcript_28612/m.101365 type:complete len:288 (+) Transcript_28612:1873-2736(+)
MHRSAFPRRARQRACGQGATCGRSQAAAAAPRPRRGDVRRLFADVALRPSSTRWPRGHRAQDAASLAPRAGAPRNASRRYRCHPAISAVASRLFYGGALVDGISAGDRAPVLLGAAPIVFVDPGGAEQKRGDGYVNAAEAAQAVACVRRLASRVASLGVICCYERQKWKFCSASLAIAAATTSRHRRASSSRPSTLSRAASATSSSSRRRAPSTSASSSTGAALTRPSRARATSSSSVRASSSRPTPPGRPSSMQPRRPGSQTSVPPPRSRPMLLNPRGHDRPSVIE